MKEKRKKDKKSKKHKRKDKEDGKKKRRYSTSSSSSEEEQWVEKEQVQSEQNQERDDWMSMTGMIRTYTKDDIKPKHEEKKKNHIDSYNPSTSVRELNPYWKDGGTGLPSDIRKSRQFIKPDDDDDNYYRKSGGTGLPSDVRKTRQFIKPDDDDNYYRKSSSSRQMDSKYDSKSHREDRYRTSYREPQSNWKMQSETKSTDQSRSPTQDQHEQHLHDKTHRSDKDIRNRSQNSIEERSTSPQATTSISNPTAKSESLYMSDEKLNKLAAKVVKAEIMGDMEQVAKLKAKLEAAREYRRQNPDAGKEDDGIMLMSTTSTGNSRPLTSSKGDARSKGGKRKAETHASGERTKYFGNDDRFNLKEMFEQEKYGTNFDDEAQLAKLAGKHTNPNDDLEDIFMDDISKNRNEAKDREVEKQRAIQQHKKLEQSLEGCEFCVDSKSMLKHLMASCGTKVYVAVPAKQSLVKNQCLISTIQHNTCVTALDEDVWEEILTYRKALTQFYNSQGQDVVFFEIATRLHRFPHMVIHCVPLPRDVGDMAAIYFKKALLECETEWSMNKKVVDLKGKDIRKGIPKGLPYFWVDFGMDPGFAHVIEDQQLFPKNFGEEIIGGMLDLDHHLWKNPRKEYGDLQRKKVLEFIKEWKPFDPSTK